MAFLIEISASNSNKSYYIHTDKNNFFLNEDRFGLFEITDKKNRESEISISQLIGSNFEIKFKNLNHRHSQAAQLRVEDTSLIFYYISNKAQYLSKLANTNLVASTNEFSLICHQLNLNLPLYAGTEISIGSSHYDSLTLIENGIKARHLELKIGNSLLSCSVKACTGKVNAIFYAKDKLSFTLSNKEAQDLEFEIV